MVSLGGGVALDRTQAANRSLCTRKCGLYTKLFMYMIRNSDCRGCAVLLCHVVCLTLLPSFLLPSFFLPSSSLIKTSTCTRM